MKKQNRRTSRVLRRTIAFMAAVALTLSSLSVPLSTDAASKKQPGLSVKRKTLYYNKAGNKSYTLKIKKKKVTIKSTKWKTSKKKVIKLSKKKKSSVKLKAKKAGKAKITAIVKYTVKGSSQVKKKKLICKVTSKAAVDPNQTQQGTGTTTAPVTDMPQTGGYSTEVPATEVPATEVPATEVPATEVPATEVPATEAPATEVPATEVPATEAPATEVPATEVPATEAPATATPVPTPVVKSVDISVSEAAISTLKDKNTVTLKAVVTDSEDKEIKDAKIVWKSDKTEIATVSNEGVVTAVKEGEANITASVGNITSKPCKVTVDAKAPTVTKAEVTDYKTITVTFNEKVKGEPAVTVKNGDKEADKMSAALAKDGKSMSISSEKALAEGTYNIVINGLSDIAGNDMAKDTAAKAEKAASVIKEFIVVNDKAPAFGSSRSLKVYYTVKDQYGEAKEAMRACGTLSVTAKIPESNYPLNGRTDDNKIRIVNSGTERGYVEIPGDTAMVAGKTISITVKNSLGDKDKTVYTSELIVTLEKADGYGQAVEVSKLEAKPAKMKNNGTAEEPQFVLTPDEADNTFTLTPTLLDKFMYELELPDGAEFKNMNNNVKYVIEDTNVLKFNDDTNETTKKSREPATFKILKAGTAKVTVYLTSDDTKSKEITIVAKPAELTGIKVGTLSAGTNNKEQKTEVTLTPATTGLKAADLSILVNEGADSFETPVLTDGTGKDVGKIFVTVKAKANGKKNKLKFVIYKGSYDAGKKEFSKETVKSDEIVYESAPSQKVSSINIAAFDENEITAEDSAETTYEVINDQNENITADAEIKYSVGNAEVLAVTEAAKGKLKVNGLKEGSTKVTLSSGTVSAEVETKVAPKRYAAEITAEKDAADVIDKDAAPVTVTLKAKDQYGKDYKLTLAEVKLPQVADLSVKYYKTVASQQGPAQEATADTDQVVAIGFTSNKGVTKDVVKEVKIESTSNPAHFEAVTLKITVKPARKENSLAFSSAALTALKGVAVINNVTLKDQYGAPMNNKANLKVIVMDAGGKDASKMAEIEIRDFDGKANAFPISVSASVSGTYTVIAYVDNDGKAGYSEKDIQASFTLKADVASKLIARIELENILKQGADYVKVAADGEEATPLNFKFKAYDADGKEIAGASSLTEGMIWSASGTDVTTTVDGSTIKVNTAKGKTTGKLTVKLHFTPGDNVIATLDVPVSSAAPVAKAGTYTIYKSDDQKKTDLKGTSMLIAYNTSIELTVGAKDQYGDDFTDKIDVSKFYSIVSTDTDFATVDASGNKLTITGVTTNAGSAVIKIMVDANTTYTVTVEAQGGDYLDLNTAVDEGAGIAKSINSDGSLTVTCTNQYTGIRIPVPADYAQYEYVETFVTTNYGGAEHTDAYCVKVLDANNQPLNGTQWGGGQFPSQSKYGFGDLEKGKSMAYITITATTGKLPETLNVKYIRFVKKVYMDMEKFEWPGTSGTTKNGDGSITAHFGGGAYTGSGINITEEFKDAGAYQVKVISEDANHERKGVQVVLKFDDSTDTATYLGGWSDTATITVPQGKKPVRLLVQNQDPNVDMTLYYIKAVPK